MYIQYHFASYICFSTEVDVGGSWLWGPPWGGLHISHPHSRVSSVYQTFTIDNVQSISGGGWTLHHVSCGCSEDKDASFGLQHPQVPKQVCCAKHPVHDEGGRVLATCTGGPGHGIGGRPSSCHVLLVLWDDERKTCAQIQAGHTISIFPERSIVHCWLFRLVPQSSRCTSWLAVVPPSFTILWWPQLRYCRRDRKIKRSQLWENSIVPFWCQVIKQRMQMCCSPFKNATSAFRVRTFFWSNFHRLSGQFF